MSNEGVWKAWQAAAFESSVLSLCSHSLSKSAFNWSDLLLSLTVHLFSSGVFVSDYVCLTVNFGLAGRVEETLYVESIVSQLWYKNPTAANLRLFPHDGNANNSVSGPTASWNEVTRKDRVSLSMPEENGLALTNEHSLWQKDDSRPKIGEERRRDLESLEDKRYW